ncbi:deoxyuridine 5'-triphosphate nucleotidohydrolase-like [Lissotriton helveticus]
MLTPALQIQPHVATNTVICWETVPGALASYRATPEAAGLDQYALKLYRLKPGDITLIYTGLGIQIPPEHFGLIAPRSGLALRGIQVLGGIIDADYQGEIKVILLNTGDADLVIQSGDRVAQMVIMPVYRRIVKKGTAPVLLTLRGEGGFISTDKNPGAKVWVESPNRPPKQAEIIATGKDNVILIMKPGQ